MSKFTNIIVGAGLAGLGVAAALVPQLAFMKNFAGILISAGSGEIPAAGGILKRREAK